MADSARIRLTTLRRRLLFVRPRLKAGELLIGLHDRNGSNVESASSRRITLEAYCLKCRTQREMKDATPVTMKNGKPATKGTCPVCSTGMYKIGKAK